MISNRVAVVKFQKTKTQNGGKSFGPVELGTRAKAGLGNLSTKNRLRDRFSR
jgi:hypothetical protein